MSSGVVTTRSASLVATRRVADYVELAKPRIAVMALVTVAAGFVLASDGSVDLVLLAHTLFGTGMLAAGASTLNQVVEKNTDALMRRTQNRPLPAGRLAAWEALAFGGLLAVGGLNYLAILVNPLTGLLGAATLVLYVFVYTLLKRRTTLNTAIGAVAGALPPVMGWAAAGESLEPAAWSLFFILFLWQFPHFLAIAWIHRDDYARAGLKMLSVLDPQGGMTGRQMIGYTLALVPVSLSPTLLALAGAAYFFGAICLGLMFLAYAVRFACDVSDASARNLLRASLVYLPALLILLLFDLTAF